MALCQVGTKAKTKELSIQIQITMTHREDVSREKDEQMTQMQKHTQGVNKKTRRNRPNPWGTRPDSKRLTAIYGPKPNWMSWEIYHSMAEKKPDDLKKAVARSQQLKVERERKRVYTQWPLGPKPDHLSKAEYHRLARKAPWDLYEIIWRTNTGPAALMPEQRVFKPTRGMSAEQKRRMENAYGILMSSPDDMELYLKKLEKIEPSLVGK